MRIGFRTSPQKTDWASLEAAWGEAGRHDVFDSGWLNDHLTDPGLERGGPSFESMTTLAALAHLVPGKSIGQTVLSGTFRHPSVLAKQAQTLDHVTGGRYILGLGAGWHLGEHEAFGIELPTLRERFDRYEASVRVLKAPFSDKARAAPGVSLEAPSSRLDGATTIPEDRDGRRRATELALAYGRAGAAELLLTTPARGGADGIRRLATEVVAPLRDGPWLKARNQAPSVARRRRAARRRSISASVER